MLRRFQHLDSEGFSLREASAIQFAEFTLLQAVKE